MSRRLPVFESTADRDALCRLFDAAGYREASLRAWLGPDGGAPRGADTAILRRRMASHPAALALVRLFAAGDAIPGRELDGAIGESGTGLLARIGLIEAAGEPAPGGGWRAVVRLVPAGDAWVASDRPDRHLAGAEDFVTGPAPVSRHLASLLPRQPVASALDLGCGSGVLALGLAAHARRVVATDLNPRAVATTRFNAMLNGIDRIDARTGDLFAPVRGERFDRIVCNPPFVLSPRPTFLYRDGGASLSRRIVREAADHLGDDGCLLMLCNWPQREDQDWRSGLDPWFAGCACDVWVLREDSFDALTYAGLWLRQQYPDCIPEGVLGEWMDHFSRAGVDSVGGGLVVMRKVSGRAPWREFRDMPSLQAPAGESIAMTCAARDRLLRLPGDDELLASRWRPSPDLEYRVTQRTGDDGWNTSASGLALRSGLQFSVQGDPVATGIVGRLDGRRSLREAASAFAIAHGVDVDFFLPNLPAAFRALAWLGLVLPVDD